MKNGILCANTKGTLLFFLIILCLLCPISLYAAVDSNEPGTVLILNSYSQGLAWTESQVRGITEGLKGSSANIVLSVEYMDWKNYPTDDNINFLHEYYEYKYKNKHIDLIIASDDVALDFALRNREDLFSNAPVVFCGVNREGMEQITNGYKNYTGVLEEIDPTQTIQLAMKINSSLKNIYLLVDNSESGLSTRKLAIEKIESMELGLNTIPLNNLTHEQLLKSVQNYGMDSIILATTYFSDVTGKIFDFERISRELSRVSSVPVYHLYEMGLNNGAFGGVMLSGELQGKNAAGLAIRVLNGENPDNIPVIPQSSTRKVVDYLQMERFHIKSNILPKDVEVINKPFSFFETYKTLVSIVLGAFLVLTAFVLILLFDARRIRRMKNRLSENHEELTQLYEELTASDEELKTQFDEISAVHESLYESEEKYRILAYHDSLTGALNKLSLYENESESLSSVNRKAALLFIDLDDFKYINDTMGHASGDRFIIEVSERLTSLLEEDCSLYRLGGDEFVIFIRSITGKDEVETFAARVFAGFKNSFSVMDSAIYVNLSMGIALYPEHARNMEELLKNADIAMYKAKESGRNKYIVYDQQMDQSFIDRANIERCLHTALERNEFELYYQPQRDAQSNKITGLEALLRWNSPELGMVSPIKFIRVAEDTHLIIPLGTWVLHSACAFLKELRQKGFHDLCMSVNISILQLLQPDFIDIVTDTLKCTDLDPGCIELEITESILMESFDAIGLKLHALRKLGVGIALDDFGKGYSSLSYLKQLPISTLKLDKSFLDDVLADDRGNILASHIIKIGKSLGLCVIAEGVERQEQLEYLLRNGCHRFQGYLYSKPLPEEKMLKFLNENHG